MPISHLPLHEYLILKYFPKILPLESYASLLSKCTLPSPRTKLEVIPLPSICEILQVEIYFIPTECLFLQELFNTINNNKTSIFGIQLFEYFSSENFFKRHATLSRPVN
jgi:hypothetical protein